MTDIVVAAVIGNASADAVLRIAFAEADRQRLPIVVLAVGACTSSAEAALHDQADRWAEKHPDVPVSVSVRRVLDPAVTLVAACRPARVLVADPSGGAAAAAVVRAVRRRVSCPVLLVE